MVCHRCNSVDKKCPSCRIITENAKEWFGMGIYDVDAMIRMGAVKESFIIDTYVKQVLKK